MAELNIDQRSRARAIVLIVSTAIALPSLSICSLTSPIRHHGYAVLGGPEVGSQDADQALSSISIDYPEDGSIFPPGITPPTFLWRDAAGTSWAIDVSFADKAPAIHILTKGEGMRIGIVDPDCIENPEDQPKLTARQAAAWTWTPDAATWAAIQSHSTGHAATVTITGYRGGQTAFSRSHIAILTSADPVGAPIFYRDVPLMPTRGVDGVVQPLAPSTIHLIKWRLRDIRQPESRTVLKNMATCANCHSFSADGKTLGMDIDGPANDKGLYALVPVQNTFRSSARIWCSGIRMGGWKG